MMTRIVVITVCTIVIGGRETRTLLFVDPRRNRVDLNTLTTTSTRIRLLIISVITTGQNSSYRVDRIDRFYTLEIRRSICLSCGWRVG